ncbi:MAG: hypothetical protein MK081_13390 [Flavobacteriales bacterium]|nr:hypothetical protein [Flavobacteriales bacterium]
MKLQARGRAVFPKLNEPDTKFNPEGIFTTKLILSPEVADPLIAKLEAMQAEAVKKAQAKKKGKRVKQQDLPIQPAYDEDGNETGDYELKTKMKASGVSNKTGNPWTRKLPLFDSTGKPTNVQVGGGSEIICAMEASAYDSASIGVGVTLRLEAVQVVNLAAGGSRSASDFAFGSVEGGFVSTDESEVASSDETSEEDAAEYEF